VNFIYLCINIIEHSDMEKKMPLNCPSCGTRLGISKMHCSGCGTEVSGDYDIPRLMRLTPREIEFIESFVASSGSLKEMAGRMNVSYPTVRNLLDDIIAKLNKMEN
jgi:hypothetical protein